MRTLQIRHVYRSLVGHPSVRSSHLVHSDLALDLASNGIFALHGFVQHMEIWKLLHIHGYHELSIAIHPDRL